MDYIIKRIMPRNDGFPTNRELQVQFTAGARDVFVASGERALQHKLEFSPVYEDKPLDHLQLVVRKRHKYLRSSQQPVDVYTEKLLVTPLQSYSAEELFDGSGDLGGEYDEQYVDGDYEAAILEYYQRIAKDIANTAVTDTLRFGNLGSSAIDAVWSVSGCAEESCKGRVGSFSKQPSRQDLVRANGFVRQAAAYMQSSLFDKTEHIRAYEHASGLSDVDPRYAMTHEYYLSMTPKLPINGHEGQEFIEHYIQAMHEGMAKCQADLAYQKAHGANDAAIGVISKDLEDYVRARIAAEKYLG